MQSYMKSKNGKSFDWNEFLYNAILWDVTPAEHKKAVILAGSWVTCACGNQCSIIERFEDGEPVNRKLNELGTNFFEEIEFKEFKKAKKTLQKIEKQSTALIKREIKKMDAILRKAGYYVAKL